MFKKGDKVLCVKEYLGWLEVGKIYQVASDQHEYNADIVCVNCPYQRLPGGFKANSYFVPAPSVDTAGATDQELANDYRRLADERKIVFDALRARGFKISTIEDGLPFIYHPSGDSLAISKTETKTVTL